MKLIQLILLALFWSISLHTMEAPLTEDKDSWEDDSSSGVSENWDEKFPFCFRQPWPVNESQLPARLCQMRVKREKIFIKFKRKEKKFHKKQLKRQFIKALESENAQLIQKFEITSRKFVKQMLLEIDSYGDFTLRKKLLLIFIMHSNNASLCNLASDLYKVDVDVIEVISDTDDEQEQNSKRFLLESKASQSAKQTNQMLPKALPILNQPKSYSLIYAKLKEQAKEKRELNKKLKLAIQENDTTTIKEFEKSHPQILYSRLVSLLFTSRWVRISPDHYDDLQVRTYDMVDCTEENEKKLKMILNIPINANQTSDKGMFALYLAIHINHLNFAKILCETPGINVNQQTPTGETALLHFIENCSGIYEKNGTRWLTSGFELSEDEEVKEELKIKKETDFVSYLLDKGAQVDLPNTKGLTPLICAASRSCYTIVELLLKKGLANPSLKDREGKNALEHYYEGRSDFFTDPEIYGRGYEEAIRYDSRIEKLLLEAMNKTS